MVNIATFNVRGLRDTTKRSKIFTFLRNKCFDVILLQETHSNKQVAKFWRSHWGGQAFFAHGDSRSRGCMILIKKKTNIKIHRQIIDSNGRYLMLDVTLNDDRILLCNIYATNDDNTLFFEEVFEKIESNKPNCIVMGGDFNTTLTPKDKYSEMSNTEPGHPKCAKYITNMCKKKEPN